MCKEKQKTSLRTGSESCSLCLMISFSLVRCSRAWLSEGSWKNIYSPGRSGVAAPALPAHPCTLGTAVAGSVCSVSFFWETEKQAPNRRFLSWGYRELSTGHFYQEPGLLVFVKVRVFVRGKQCKLSFSVMLFMHWGKTCEVRSIIVNYCSWPILPFCFQHVAFALYFSPVSMLCR